MTIIKRIFSWFQSKFGLEPVKQLQAPNLQVLNLQNLKLQETNISEVNLQEAKLQQAKLQQSDFTINQNNKKIFEQSLKITNIPKKVNKKIETLICYGDGLGIEKKLSY